LENACNLTQQIVKEVQDTIHEMGKGRNDDNVNVESFFDDAILLLHAEFKILFNKSGFEFGFANKRQYYDTSSGKYRPLEEDKEDKNRKVFLNVWLQM
jgi:hypothetical protein